MPLTDEERRKIYEEEKARLEVRKEIDGEKKGHGCLIAASIVAGIFIVLAILVTSNKPTRQIPDNVTIVEAKPYLKIKTEEVEYHRGYFKVIGIIKNTGNKSAFSPTLVLRVFDITGVTLLAEDIGWPAGHYLKNFDPGSSAAFQLMCSVPRDPNDVKWQLNVKDYEFDIEYGK